MEAILVIGTRPQIIKSAPLIQAASENTAINISIVHTGQHYDYEMSKQFFNELSLPDPTVNLGVGSGTHAWQTGNMLIELEKALTDSKPDAVIVPGDTNSTLAGALAAAKMNIPLIHLESGCRSYDMTMPEEVNRRVTDHISSTLLTVSKNCNRILQGEGIKPDKIALVGDTMYESIKNHMDDIDKDQALKDYGLAPEEYAVITLHRAENVDNQRKLKDIITTITELDTKIVFPCHPRTENRLRETNLMDKILSSPNVMLVKPVGYYRMLNLMKNARIVFTDSGGMQKESFWLHTPCITMRENTEWIETLEVGANTLTGSNPPLIKDAVKRILNGEISREKISTAKNPYDIGGASQAILRELEERYTT